MNKKVFALVLFLCLILLSACNKIDELNLRQKIDQANFCETADDCALAGSRCPFGCYIYVNTKERAAISAQLNQFHSACAYSCVSCESVACVQHMCQPICNGTVGIR